MIEERRFIDSLGYLDRLDKWINKCSSALMGGNTTNTKSSLQMFLDELIGQVDESERDDFYKKINNLIDNGKSREAYSKMQIKYHELGLAFDNKEKDEEIDLGL